MGRDWYWSNKSAIGTGSSSSSSTVTAKKEEMRETPGCMSAVLNLFYFHRFQFPISHPCFKPNSILQQDPTSIKGVEAPRNSLESEDECVTMAGSSSVSTELHREEFDMPVQIRVGATKPLEKDICCSDSSSSPGPKTPSLIARLMGLDILPDTLSSSSSPSVVKPNKIYGGNDLHYCKKIETKSNKHKRGQCKYTENENLGSRSLPDTPRVSSARRSDVGPRYSLQIIKENTMNIEEWDYFSQIARDQKSRKRELRNGDEENRSPGHYARQIVKQVKENVSRRVGLLDITNTTTTTATTANKSKEVDIVLLKSKKPKRLTKIGEESNSNKQSTSPRLRLCEYADHVSKPRLPPLPLPPPPPPVPISKLSAKARAKQKPKPLPQHQTMEKCKKASCERFTQRKEACAVRGSKCTNTQLTKDIAVVTTESTPSTSLSHDDHFQVSKPCSRLSSCTSRSISTRCMTPSRNDREDNERDLTDEMRYISEILKCTGINENTLISITKWFSFSYPLDPFIFHRLENLNIYVTGSLKHRCNRRMIFELVDKMLAHIMNPYLNMKPWLGQYEFCQKEMRGDRLLQCLCHEMRKLPASNCQSLQDIDDLIEKDLAPDDAKMRMLPTYEETESIVFVIQQDILDSLVHETVADVIQKRRPKFSTRVTWAFT